MRNSWCRGSGGRSRSLFAALLLAGCGGGGGGDRAPDEAEVPVARFVYMVNGDRTLTIHAVVDQVTGELLPRGYVAPAFQPTTVTAHPSGEFVYATSELADVV